MKLIALLPVLNEEWILPTYLNQMLRFTSTICAMDSGSTDNSLQILLSHNIPTRSIKREKNQKNGSIVRNELLNWGRQLGGTHFFWLDADEIFSSNFHGNYRSYLSKMRPGQKLWMDWIPVWKNPQSMLIDEKLIWPTLKKDFIFFDDRKSSFDDELVHESRTPGPNSSDTLLSVSRADGVSLHYQFANWNRFQAKQCWYRCLEVVTKNQSIQEINSKYRFTLYGRKARVSPLPNAWLDKVVLPISYPYMSYIAEIIGLFNIYGITMFETLDIWHIEELKDEFTRRTHRLPKQLLLKNRLASAVNNVKMNMHRVYLNVTH